MGFGGEEATGCCRGCREKTQGDEVQVLFIEPLIKVRDLV
jgi:hypothetical protein